MFLLSFQVAGEHRYHPECFQCCSCYSYIGDGEGYALVERTKLYWFVLPTNISLGDINLANIMQCLSDWLLTYYNDNSKLYILQKNIYHHHHVVPLAQISLTLSRHFSLSFITSGSSSGLHPVSSHSCWMYVWASRPAFARPYVGVYRSTSLMSSSLLLQQCPVCLVRLTWIVFVIGGRWSYSWYYLPTPPLGQDMTQGQFLSGV